MPGEGRGARSWPCKALSRSKRARLTDSPEFEKVYRSGISYRGKLFSVHAFPNDSDTARLGLSVSKKVGNAIVRNKVRRRLKEIFRERSQEIKGLDIVISARPPASEANFGELCEEFERSLRRLDSGPKRR